jgi:hypothetical protein
MNFVLCFPTVFTAHCAPRQLAQVPFPLVLFSTLTQWHAQGKPAAENERKRNPQKCLPRQTPSAPDNPIYCCRLHFNREPPMSLCVVHTIMCFVVTARALFVRPSARPPRTLEITNNSQPTQSLNFALVCRGDERPNKVRTFPKSRRGGRPSLHVTDFELLAYRAAHENGWSHIFLPRSAAVAWKSVSMALHNRCVSCRCKLDPYSDSAFDARG